MNGLELDQRMRSTAFRHVAQQQQLNGYVSAEALAAGFMFDGQRIPLINPQRGIFKPRQMQRLLSIRTVFPRTGNRVWYDDQRVVHQQVFEGTDGVDYAFMGNDPKAADNRWLREAFEEQTPIIYFLGTSPGRYQALVPTYVVGWDANALRARLTFGVQDELQVVPPEAERRYAMRTVQQRLHQAFFRDAVITAYNGRCALSALPEPMLLDAAHIVADRDQDLGHPIVPNGIPLSKIHHAAFDAHLLGIDPDFRVHVAGRLLSQRDGPMLESLKRLNGSQLHLPARPRDQPDRDRLAVRFAQFLAAAA
jgi:putative restriction endonuclease